MGTRGEEGGVRKVRSGKRMEERSWERSGERREEWGEGGGVGEEGGVWIGRRGGE